MVNCLVQQTKLIIQRLIEYAVRTGELFDSYRNKIDKLTDEIWDICYDEEEEVRAAWDNEDYDDLSF